MPQFCLLVRRSQESGNGPYAFDVVPHPHVLVECVLIVVAVDERDDDEGGAEDLDEGVGGDAAAHHADANGSPLDWSPTLAFSFLVRQTPSCLLYHLHLPIRRKKYAKDRTRGW